MRFRRVVSLLFVLMVSGAALFAQTRPAKPRAKSQPVQEQQSWTFAVSGDSRNCGNVVMPAIAAASAVNKASFYWHLGDLRATYRVDEDYQQEPEHRGQMVGLVEYNRTEWDDFIQSQVKIFGKTPVFVGIGNHETTPPQTREMFIAQFADWLDSPVLQKQRLADNPEDHRVKAYFHWIQGGVDFIYLDNATRDQLDDDQVRWFEGVLERATANPQVKAVVVGMHAALPDSLSLGHSMSDWPVGVESGRRVYTDLLKFRENTRKQVYVLSSHSHFYMSGIYNSDYWRANGGVLPGWIVGTAGAVRYALPPLSGRAQEARTAVYGFLLATVHPNGTIDFAFHEVKRGDVPAPVVQRFTTELVDQCFSGNSDVPIVTAAPAK